MKKFFKNYGYALGIFLYFTTLLIVAGCSKTSEGYDDLNKHVNSEILKITIDSTKTPIDYQFYIKDSHGRYKELSVDPDWAVIFEEGDDL